MATVRYIGDTRVHPGQTLPAVDQLNLEIADGKVMVLVGPSGSGKSTALRMLARLEALDAGSIQIGDADVSHRWSKDRDVVMVLQNYALYPQRGFVYGTVRGDQESGTRPLAFGLEGRVRPRHRQSDPMPGARLCVRAAALRRDV